MTELAQSWPSGLDDIRLVVCDLDGTLLDPSGKLPAGFWDLWERLRARGAIFAAASGRPYPVLHSYFASLPEGIAYIAENGSYVVRDGVELSSSPVDPDAARAAVDEVRSLNRHRYVGATWCARNATFAERDDEPFLSAAHVFYPELVIVSDLLALYEQALKVAVYDVDDPWAESAPALERRCQGSRVVGSAPHWLDVMDPVVNKGVALRALQASLGVTADQTVAFGDYLNDLELLAAATHSFAMENGHPDVIAQAAHVAPSNEVDGVITVMNHLLSGS